MPFPSKQIALCWWKEVELTCHVLTGLFFFLPPRKIGYIVRSIVLESCDFPYVEQEIGDLKLKS